MPSSEEALKVGWLLNRANNKQDVERIILCEVMLARVKPQC